MSDFWYVLLVVIILCFSFVCFFGAPFVPTRKKWANEALGLVEFNENDLVVDLGSGDGTILRLLAERGVSSVGYELNPILWLVSKLRFASSELARVELANFWKQDLPEKTTVVYVFAVMRDAKRLENYFSRQAKNGKFKVITFGFELPSKKVIKQTGGAFLYQF